jgi:hypothetical protein
MSDRGLGRDSVTTPPLPPQQVRYLTFKNGSNVSKALVRHTLSAHSIPMILIWLDRDFRANASRGETLRKLPVLYPPPAISSRQPSDASAPRSIGVGEGGNNVTSFVSPFCFTGCGAGRSGVLGVAGPPAVRRRTKLYRTVGRSWNEIELFIVTGATTSKVEARNTEIKRTRLRRRNPVYNSSS